MYLRALRIERVRRIQQAQLAPGDGINVICGENGSGKTSALEAVHLLATGRSFRTPRAVDVITDGETSMLVSGDFVDSDRQAYRVGVEKTATTTRLRLNGDPVQVASKIARLVPVLNFNADWHLLMSGGPSNRRALVDRLLFHVEQPYLDVFKQYVRAMKQRNALLRQRSAVTLATSWHERIESTAERLDQWRAGCVAQLNETLASGNLCEYLGSIALEYRRGWSGDSPLSEQLTANWARDSLSGNTSIGPHRAELRLKFNGKAAKSIVSRGQGKLIIAALVSAQAQYLRSRANQVPILLVDDLASELDREARRAAAVALRNTRSQLFFTAIESTDLPRELLDTAQMFHVEHGVITSLSNDHSPGALHVGQ